MHRDKIENVNAWLVGHYHTSTTDTKEIRSIALYGALTDYQIARQIYLNRTKQTDLHKLNK